MSINRCMGLLVEELRDDGMPDPLYQSFTLAAIWDDLCRTTGEQPHAVVRTLLEDAAGATELVPSRTSEDRRGAPGSQRQRNGATVNTLFAALIAELEAEDVPRVLSQPLTLGLIWADLCRLADEAVPTTIRDMLDTPAVEAMLCEVPEVPAAGRHAPAIRGATLAAGGSGTS